MVGTRLRERKRRVVPGEPLIDLGAEHGDLFSRERLAVGIPQQIAASIETIASLRVFSRVAGETSFSQQRQDVVGKGDFTRRRRRLG